MLVVKLSDAFWLFHVSGWQDECCLVASLVIGCRINSCFRVSLLLLVAKFSVAFWLSHVIGWQVKCCLVASSVVGWQVKFCLVASGVVGWQVKCCWWRDVYQVNVWASMKSC